MALPINYDTVQVRGKYVYLNGNPASGQVRFSGKVIAVSDETDTIIVPTSIVAPIVDGVFSVELPATDDPDIQPNGWTYTVTEELANGGGRQYEIDVPLSAKGTGIDLSEVAPVTPASGNPTAFVTLTTYYSSSPKPTYLNLAGAPYNVKADGTTDNRAAIQAAINSLPVGGGAVLPPGLIGVSSAINIPPGRELMATHGNRTDQPQQTSVLRPLPNFTGTAVIRLLDKEEGGYSVENEGVRLTNITIDGTGSPAGVGGIHASGRVHGVVLDRVCVQNTTGPTLMMSDYTRSDSSTQHPFSWNLWHCMASNTNGGWNILKATDCTLLNVQALGVTGHGFTISAAPNTQLIGCRSEWSSQRGFYITGNWLSGQGAGGLQMTGCSTDRNSWDGVYIDSTGTAQMLLNGNLFRRDGRNGYPGTGGGEYAAVKVANSSTPVVINGISVFPGTGDDGAGVSSPQYGVHVTGSTAVVLSSGYIHAATTPILDNGGNTAFIKGLDILTATGPSGAPNRSTSINLDIPGYALGMPTPREHGLVAWTSDPAFIGSGRAGTSGTVYLNAVYVHKNTSISSIRWGVNTVASGVTAGQNFVGLYNSSGTLLASAGVDSDITSTGVKNTAIAPGVLTPGIYWVAFLFNATTPPAIYRSSELNATLLNVNIPTASQYRFAINGTGRTSLASSITPSANTVSGIAYWAAVA